MPAPEPAELTAERSQVADVLADARLLLWSATVRRSGGDFRWELRVAPESARSPLLAYTQYREHGFLWNASLAPDFDAMEATYRNALARGADRYEHEFRIAQGGRTLWLQEVVRIVPTGPDKWQFTGLLRDVTEQRLAEVGERKAMVELRRLVHHAQCMLWYATVTDAPVGQQPTWALNFLPSALQRRIFDHIDPLVTQGLYEAFEVPQMSEMHARANAALRGGATGYEQEFKLTRKRDGQSFWLREHVAITANGAGSWQLSGVMIDVTAQKAAELARHATEMQLQRLLDQVDCIVWSASLTPDPANEYRWELNAPPSRLHRRLFARDPSPPIAFWDAEHTPDFAEMDRHWRQAIAAGADGYEQEFRYNIGGTTLWLHEKVTVLRRDGGTMHLAGVVIDITERKLAEQRLSAEKDQLAVILRAMDEAVVTVSPEGRITYLNRAAEELLQVRAERAVGQVLAELAVLQAGQPPQVLSWPIGGAPADLAPNAEMVRATGSRVHVEGCSAPFHDPLGKSTGTVIVLRDVTERHLLQSQVQRASALESIGLLAGGIAHDFNNILTALLANLSLAELETAAETPLADYLREARAATDRASALARQLLTFAQGGDPVLAAVDLGGVIREVTQFTLRGMNVDHTFEIAANLWPARADRGQLAQIIQNLVLNAAQAMADGGTIRISAGNADVPAGFRHGLIPGRYVRLQVADTGLGIEPEALKNIFTPYFTTKRSGHGLGLAVVYSIVKKHGGSIDVRSRLNEGTTFDLYLPAAREAQADERPHPVAAAQKLSGRVLVMDDDDAIRSVLGAYLRRAGLEVDTTEDGQAAIDCYREALARGAPHDIVIMDLTVPGKMGGSQAMAVLKSIDPNVRAIVASGYSNDPVLARYQDYGFRAVAAKPFEITKLREQIVALLEAGNGRGNAAR